jgi:uncharacterized protein YjbJ (UPF0337 family)
MNEAILEGNWDKIKGKLREHFGDFTNDDVESIKGSYEKFEGKLKEVYGYKKAEAQKEIENFLGSEDWKTLKDGAHNFKDTLIKNAHQIKDRAEHFVNNSMGDIKDKMGDLKDHTVHAQENVITYVKENPVKSLGLAVLAGLIAGVLFKKS